MSVIVSVGDSAPVHGLIALLRLLLHPLVSGALLAALKFAPAETRAAVLCRAATVLPAALAVTPKTATRVLLVVFSWGVVRALNRAANAAASNSWCVSAAGSRRRWNDWSRELAVVTGGCSGIGLRTVERLAARGVRVAVLDLQPLPKSLEGHRHVRFFHCDVTDPASVRAAADAVRATFRSDGDASDTTNTNTNTGDPSILINNAGIAIPRTILNMPHDSLLKVFQVNTISHWYLAQAFVPAMIRANKGHIVTVASIASFIALASGADYSCTKASALAFHESLGSELRNLHHPTPTDGILTTVIHPNFVRTPLVAAFVDRLESAGIRLLTADDVARHITDQIFSARGAQIVCPRHLSLVTGFRSWPAWLQNGIRDEIAKSSEGL